MKTKRVANFVVRSNFVADYDKLEREALRKQQPGLTIPVLVLLAFVVLAVNLVMS